MKRKILSVFVAFVGVVLLFAFPTWADFDDAENAYLREDFETAFKEWEPLAYQGNVKAQNMLGFMYRWGQGVEQDFAKAQEWYRRAADKGYPTAQNNLGLVFRYGLGVPQDYQQAFHWFLRAAEQGNAAGQNHLGLMYFKGEGVEKDYVQSYKWALLAAEQGMDPAIQALTMLEEVLTPAQIDAAKRLAREWKPKGREEVL